MTGGIEQRRNRNSFYRADKLESGCFGKVVVVMTLLLIPVTFMIQLVDLLPGVKVDRSVNLFLVAGGIFLTLFPLWLVAVYCWWSARMAETIQVSEEECSVIGFFGGLHVVKWEAVIEVRLSRWTGVITIRGESDAVRVGDVFRAPHEVLSYVRRKLPRGTEWDERILAKWQKV